MSSENAPAPNAKRRSEIIPNVSIDTYDTSAEHGDAPPPSAPARMGWARRWQYLGLVNEPCFEKGQRARQDRYGLWLDVRQKDCPPDPFENEKKYSGVEIGARGKNMPAAARGWL